MRLTYKKTPKNGDLTQLVATLILGARKISSSFDVEHKKRGKRCVLKILFEDDVGDWCRRMLLDGLKPSALVEEARTGTSFFDGDYIAITIAADRKYVRDVLCKLFMASDEELESRSYGEVVDNDVPEQLMHPQWGVTHYAGPMPKA